MLAGNGVSTPPLIGVGSTAQQVLDVKTAVQVCGQVEAPTCAVWLLHFRKVVHTSAPAHVACRLSRLQ